MDGETVNKIRPGEPGYYRAIARQAVADIVANFWKGDAPDGYLIPTWDGYPGDELPDNRGAIWESAMLHFCIYDTWVATGDEDYRKLLVSEAAYIRGSFGTEELENAGGNQLWWCDDCGWNAMLFLNCYQITGDTWFVDRAINLLDNVVKRWYSEELNGLYYKDDGDFMALYEVSIALSWLRLKQITGEQRFYDLALRSYEGMHARLGQGRDDGLYYCEANLQKPFGRKEDIAEARSSSFLAGNLGMAALAAKFYRLTGNEEYLNRVYRTNQGLLEHYVLEGGILLNDRDAWTNGVFTSFYVSEVLSLPGTEELAQILRNTAQSIVTNARTEQGYYGGSWQGPAEGEGSKWFAKGSVPKQSMTTATSVLMVVAAAIAEAGIKDYVR